MLLGRDIDDPLVSAHAQAFPSSLHSSSSPSRPVLAKPDGTTFSPEEILALQLKTAKDAATLATGGDMSFDTVITVRLRPYCDLFHS